MSNPDEIGSRMVAFDPGGVHVGVALFEEKQDWWYCSDAYERTPEQAADWLAAYAADLDIVVWERFTLDPRLMKQQIGSEMPTCELIGVFKYWSRRYGHLAWAGVGRDSKTTAASWCRAHGVKSVAKKSKAGGHAKDAELIGWSYLIQTGLAVPERWPDLTTGQ